MRSSAGARSVRAKPGIDQLCSDIDLRVHNIEGAAGSVASGNLAAIGGLLSDLENDPVVGTQIVNDYATLYPSISGSRSSRRACAGSSSGSPSEPAPEPRTHRTGRRAT